MPACNVLRCTAPAAHVIRLMPEDEALMEAAVCDEHKAAIDAGVPARWDPDPEEIFSGAIVMGDDLTASGLTITRLLSAERHGLVRAWDGTKAVTLVMEAMKADGTRETVRLNMSQDLLAQLVRRFPKYWAHPEQDSSSGL
jgi:hypothetical protein